MAKVLQLLGLSNLKEIANARIYLLSDASRWVTGSYLVVDGGVYYEVISFNCFLPIGLSIESPFWRWLPNWL